MTRPSLSATLIVTAALAVTACSGSDPDTETPDLEQSVWTDTPGSSEHTCVDIDALLADQAWTESVGPDGTVNRSLHVRSGEFLAGNFYELGGIGQRGSEDFVAKIWWAPLDPDVAQTETLVVTVDQLDVPERPPQTITLDGNPAFAGAQYFWPSGIPLPETGRWQLTATTPDHWGCYLLSV